MITGTTPIDPWNRAPCRWCGMLHGPACPYVKAVEFYPDGITIKRVEFREPGPAIATGQPGSLLGFELFGDPQ